MLLRHFYHARAQKRARHACIPAGKRRSPCRIRDRVAGFLHDGFMQVGVEGLAFGLDAGNASFSRMDWNLR